MFGTHAPLVASIAVGLLGFSTAHAANYYVSPSGSDNAPGTLSQPFQTIQQAAYVMAVSYTHLTLPTIYSV